MTVPRAYQIAVAGATGRMGHMLIEAVLAADDCVLSGALDLPGQPAIGNDATAFLGQTSAVTITADLHTGLTSADVLIDFTRPEGTLAHLEVCRALGVKAVIGTTGFSDGQKARIAEVARDPAAITRCSRNAWTFSRAHGFQPEFQRRMEHLARIAGATLLPVGAL